MRHRVIVMITLVLSIIASGFWLSVDRREPTIKELAQHIAISPDGAMLAAATLHGIQLWDLPELSHRTTLDAGEAHSLVAWSPDGAYIVTNGTNFTIDIWNVPQRKRVQTLIGPTTTADGVAFSPDGRLVAATDRDSHVRIWQWREQKLRLTRSHFLKYVSSVAFSPDGTLLATGNAVTEVWRVNDGQQVLFPAGKGGDINNVAFSANGQYLVAGDATGNIHIWDVAQRKLLHTIVSHNGAITALAISSDSQSVAVGGGMTYQQVLGETTVKVWNLQTGTLVATLPTTSYAINALTFLPNEPVVIVASDDGSIALRRFMARNTQPSR